jgi:PAS domain S-box-containing protein
LILSIAAGRPLIGRQSTGDAPPPRRAAIFSPTSNHMLAVPLLGAVTARGLPFNNPRGPQGCRALTTSRFREGRGAPDPPSGLNRLEFDMSDENTTALRARIAELEAALDRHTAWWNEMVDAFSDWACLIDADFNVVRSNRAVEDLLGLKREAVVGHKCYELACGGHEPPPSCPVSRMLETGRRAQADIELPGGRWLAVTVDPLIDRAGRIGGAIHMARDITAAKQSAATREALIAELQQTLAEVKTLKGLIPICAHCKKIRNDQGYWTHLEAFVSENFEAEVSHGMCPACLKQCYGDSGLY